MRIGAAIALTLLVAGQALAAPPVSEDTGVEGVAERLLEPDDIYPVTSDQFRAILDHHRGKVVMVNIWATWCKPCLDELPSLDGLQHTFRDRLRVLAVSADDPKGMKKIRRYFREHAPGLTSYVAVGPPSDRRRKGKKERLEESRQFIRAFYEDWPSRFPTTLIYDADGRLRETVIGTRSYLQFAKLFEGVLEDP
ncbi:MAG: TlpA disulfide reductase family protein [Acidobacteria bacterium]|nr:TlpA disulfide reductase family protein [Acidobacteriota bacterium]